MAIEEDFLKDAEDDARTIEYIRAHLPQELQEKFDEEELYYFLDVIIDYYIESGILDAAPDKDGYVEIDTESIARYLADRAKKERMGSYDPDDLLFFVQAHLEYEEEESK